MAAPTNRGHSEGRYKPGGAGRSGKHGAAVVPAEPIAPVSRTDPAPPARDADPDSAMNARLDETRFVLDEAAYAKVVAMIDDPSEPAEAQKKFMAVRSP